MYYRKYEDLKEYKYEFFALNKDNLNEGYEISS
jgi:hypothetical protein